MATEPFNMFEVFRRAETTTALTIIRNILEKKTSCSPARRWSPNQVCQWGDEERRSAAPGSWYRLSGWRTRRTAPGCDVSCRWVTPRVHSAPVLQIRFDRQDSCQHLKAKYNVLTHLCYFDVREQPSFEVIRNVYNCLRSWDILLVSITRGLT